MEKIRVLELFAGIGACSKALERQGIEHEIVDAVEIDKYAIESFNAIHDTNFEVQDIRKWDKEIEVDLIMHGSPCQDFSVAGKQAGGDEGTGTRSSLMYETIRIVNKLKPKYVIWENVRNLLSKKHKHNFDNYINQMEELGYNSYYQILNSKDYGIPQNRERVFTISIRKDIDKGYKFPEKEELKLRLKDLLEEEVDEKYYLSDAQIDNIKFSNFTTNQRKIQEKQYCDTLCARDYKDPKCVRVGGIFDTEKSTHQAGSIYDKDGLSPTLDVMQGGWRQPSIIEDFYKNRPIREYTEIAPTLRSERIRLKVSESSILIKNNTKQGYLEAEYEDEVYTNSSNKRGMVQKGMAQTLTGFQDKGVVIGSTQKHAAVTNDGTVPTLTSSMGTGGGHVPMHNFDLRIRKLTPLECWRLQGFNDEDFYKAKERLNRVFYKGKDKSNSQLYKQAGNSITVNVLEKIFKNLFEGE